MKYNPKIVIAWMAEQGIPTPATEYKFHPTRKWPMDFAWPDNWRLNAIIPSHSPVALEVDGGIWIHGAHNRGVRMLKTWEKENEAACLGWRILRCQPRDLCTADLAAIIKRALGI